MAIPELRPVSVSQGLAYEVTAAGEVHGLRVEVGDRILCGPTPRLRDRVVLAPAGRGAPVVGLKEGARLFGPARERCHPSRWTAAGRIEGVWRAATGRVESVEPVAFGTPRRAVLAHSMPAVARWSPGVTGPTSPASPSAGGDPPVVTGPHGPSLQRGLGRLGNRQLALFPVGRRAA